MSGRFHLCLFIALLAAVLPAALGLAAPRLQVFANGKRIALEAPAAPIDGVTYLPLRPAAEALAARLEWVEKSKTAVLCRGNVCYPVRATDPASGARLVDGRLLLPLRQLAAALGCRIAWDARTHRVDLTTE